VAVRLRAELGHPLDVLLCLDVPARWQAFHVGDHVAIRGAAPHGPIAGTRIGSRNYGHQGANSSTEQAQKNDSVGFCAFNSHLFAYTFMLSKYSSARPLPNIPGAPWRFGIGSTRSISHALGSGSFAGHALPRARVVPSDKFATSSLRRYQVSGFQVNGTLFVRWISGCHGSRCSIWLLPKRVRQ